MENNKKEIPAAAAAVLLILLSICGHATSSKTYFVRLKTTSPSSSLEERNKLYSSSLESSSIPTTKIIYSYKHLDGFAVTLSDEEARLMSARDDVQFVQPTQMYKLHTTRTPLFMGMEGSGGAAAPQLPGIVNGSQVIIGVLDTGVWPESPSFNDAGLGPVPTRFKGGCHKDSGIKCNKKLIGARAFYKGYEEALAQINQTMEMLNQTKTARDTEGHGTHTISTAGGSAVPHASLLGFANGTAHGMAQFARVAMYKVCWAEGCTSADILAGMDQAIEDNVDVMSLSLGGDEAGQHYMDPVAIGAFAATQKGILVSCSAGNAGPEPSLITNVAPWILTVGAGTLDRDFPAPIKLGNNKTFNGVSLYKDRRGGTPLLPLVDARDASIDGNNSFCVAGTLVPAKVKGKIVLCERGNNSRVEKGLLVEKAGGLGMVLANDALNGDELVADAHLVPATAVTFKTAQEIRKYMAESKDNACASIKFGGTVVGIEPSPVLASFSSRGPNPLKQDRLLKPDLFAPGVNILAAWPNNVGPTGLPTDKRFGDFNIISGTSMSCPHVSGLAAMMKAAHPGWSPAAIRSALMTTAHSTYTNGKPILDAATGKPATPNEIGAGHVAPMAALDPGLVYDLTVDDYFNFLCALKYGPKEIGSLTHTKFACDKKRKYRVSDLNYPSFVVSVEEASWKGGVTHTRTLTNVGKSVGTYKVSVLSPSSSVNVSVHPETLTFNEKNKKQSYEVKFQVVKPVKAGESLFARIEWSDDQKQHVVGSPIAFS